MLPRRQQNIRLEEHTNSFTFNRKVNKWILAGIGVTILGCACSAVFVY